MAEVVGTNTAGIGVSGTGSNYGVYGTSTGNFAGAVGKNASNSTAPGVYAQTVSTAPGLLAISGLASLVDALFSTDLDAAAASWAGQNPNKAGLFIGDVAITGALHVGTSTAGTLTLTGALSGPSGSFTGTVNVGGALTGTTCVFQGSAQTGVHGFNGSGSGDTPKFGCGVWGESNQGYGVYGASKTASGVYGTSGSGGLAGEFAGNVKVTGKVTATDVAATGTISATGNVDVTGKVNATDVVATGNIDVTGNVNVSGDIFLKGADCAEQFDLKACDIAEPGTVMVIADDGTLRHSEKAYDRCVAGVVSGAGSFKPGIVLDQHADNEGRATIALVGKVYCKVDADDGPIAVGDLLTTSHTPGHAMKVADPLKAFGAVIGKALQPLQSGRGLVPILVALQ